MAQTQEISISTNQHNYCIATVTSDNFLPGTIVMLDSFLQHHRQFSGDICIIHNGLSDQSCAILEAHFESLKFKSAGHQLTEAVDRLTSAYPGMKSRQARFLSVEMFALTGYDKVLFCDSDLLFRGSIASLWAHDSAVVCCGDGAYYRGLGRDPKTFTEVALDAAADVLQKPFNAGLMLVDGGQCSADNYAAIIGRISPERWQKVRTGHTDQLLYNLHFADRVTLVSPAYNYLLAYGDAIIEQSGTTLSDAAVLHYNGPMKPWLPNSILAGFRQSPMIVRSTQLWSTAFHDFLKRSVLGTVGVGPSGS